MYILLGTALDGISMIVLTTAIVIPMIKTAGLDPVWFGIFLVLVVEMAEVSPPVGFNLFVLQTMSGKDSNFVALASLPFFFLLVVAVALITVFPSIVMMRAADGVSRLAQRGCSMLSKRLASITGMAALLSAFALPAAAQTKWNLPAAYPTDNPHTVNLLAFAKDVNDVTGGKLQITVHAGASLFKAPEIKRAVMTGQAQMGEVLISVHENEDPLFGIDVIPFLATSYPLRYKLWQASKPAIEKKLAAQGLMLLFAVPWGPQGIYAKKDLNSVEDMKGLKWRAYNVGTARIADLVGAQPVTIQAAELPQALATGVVNAFMTSGSTGYDSKAWETMSHFYDTQAWIPKNLTFVNKAAFDALDEETQAAILKAAAAAEPRGWKLAEEKAGWYLEQLKANKMKVLPPSEELKSGLLKIGDQLTIDWTKKAGADGEAVISSYRKM